MASKVENERVFEHYLDFTPELRMMIVDEMQAADRCRFTRCSELSQKEAKASKNYIHGLELMVHRENDAYEIHEVQDLLDIGRTTFTNEQFLRLSAPEVHIHIGDLTEKDIYHFIQSWKNGTLGKKIKNYSWRKTRESTFNKIKLFRLLGLISDDDEERTLFEFEIKHFKESGVSAVLKYGNEEDVFDYEENDDDDEEDDDEDVEENMEENDGKDGQDDVEEEAGNEMEVGVDDWDKVLWFYVKNDEE